MSLQRKFIFYSWSDGDTRFPFDPDVCGDDIAALEDDERVFKHSDGRLTAVEYDADNSRPECRIFRLYALHDEDNQPSQWEASSGPTELTIAQDSYTAFLGHVAIWEDQVAAIESHVNCPALGRFAEFIRARTSQKAILRPLYNPEAASRLEDLTGVRGIEFSIHDPAKMSRARQNGMIGSLLPNNSYPSVKVALGMGQGTSNDAYLDEGLAEEIENVAPHAEEFFDRMVIRGRDEDSNEIVEINLLAERIADVRNVDRNPENPGVPDSASVALGFRSARIAIGHSLEAAADGHLHAE